MKNLIALFVCTFFVGSTLAIYKSSPEKNIEPTMETVLAEEEVKSNKNDLIKWDQTTHDFGEIPQNIPVTAYFTLTNNTGEPLILTNVKGSCGCTVADYDSNPIKEGETSVIEATFNAKQKGVFHKTVNVITQNSKTPIILKLKGTIIKDDINQTAIN